MVLEYPWDKIKYFRKLKYIIKNSNEREWASKIEIAVPKLALLTNEVVNAVYFTQN